MLFGNFSESSQNVLRMAAAESKMLNHFYLGTEHLFIGLCKVDDEPIRRIFEQFAIDPLIRREIRAKVRVAGDLARMNEMIFTPRVHAISKIADEMARAYQIPQIEPLHLFLALLRGGDRVVVRMLKSKGFDLERIMSTIEEEVAKAAEAARLSPSSQKTAYSGVIRPPIPELVDH